jgi:hypothetical protein
VKRFTESGLAAVPLGVCVAILSLVLVGCGRNEVTVYKVAKEQPSPAPQAAHSPGDGHNHDTTEAGTPQLAYTLPTGWEEVPPGQMRVASFRVNEGGKLVDLSVVPLPGMAGGDLENVNRWRKQVGLEAVSQDELGKLGTPVEIAGQQAQLYDQAGVNASSGENTRILATVLRREGTAWFFKATGDDALVAKNRPAFVEFLKSVRFGAPEMMASELPPSHPPITGTPMMAGGAKTSAAAGDHPEWMVPAGWKELPAGQFLVAKFQVGGEKSETAVNVSTSVGDGGGLTGNVNRWRKQLGLSEVSEAEIAKSVTVLTLARGKASLVDLSGTDARTSKPARVIGAMVPVQGSTWFYKLMGDAQVVEQEKQSFLKFVETVNYPHA